MRPVILRLIQRQMILGPGLHGNLRQKKPQIDQFHHWFAPHGKGVKRKARQGCCPGQAKLHLHRLRGRLGILKAQRARQRPNRAGQIRLIARHRCSLRLPQPNGPQNREKAPPSIHD